MGSRWIVTLTLLWGGAGCLPPREAPPRIVGAVDEPLVLPPQVTAPHPAPAHPDVPAAWIPPKRVEHGWEGIVIHHSGTPNGNAAIFDRWHRERNHWEGVGYDFVIGNGSDSGDGAVEVTFRWRRQMVGAHCKTPDNWANRQAVGICLVGNFNETAPTAAQMESLRRLVRFLMARYQIPAARVYGHGQTPGAHITECPGRLLDLRAVL